jgi:hypothetical protein
MIVSMTAMTVLKMLMIRPVSIESGLSSLCAADRRVPYCATEVDIVDVELNLSTYYCQALISFVRETRID